MSKEIIINHLEQEIRVAILENNQLQEIFYERIKDKSVVGNVYKGKVLKVLPGMESAFVDIGLAKAAFLYVDDVRSERDDEFHEKPESDDGNKKKIVAKKPNISSLIREGQSLIVQVSKGPIGSKGARVTCNISIPGRNLVFIPNVNNVGVSRQIVDERERKRLKHLVSKIKEDKTGFIVRTVAEGRSEDEFRSDVDYLINTWRGIEKSFEKKKPAAILYQDINLTFRTLRDMLSAEVKSMTIDDPKEYEILKDYLDTYLPKYTKLLNLFKHRENIFDFFHVNVEVDRALLKKVWLKSGGYLIIDHAEALTAIDVNTGRFTGSNSHENTILQTNLEAAVEIVYQLKLREIGGIIIIDFIDMETQENRNKVYQILKEELKKDKARSKILAISEIGLVEMTRKRSRENLDRFLCMPCPYCAGKARVKSPVTTVYDIYRDINRLRKQKNISNYILLGVHPDIAEYIEDEEMDTFRAMERLIKGEIVVRTSERLHIEQYEIYDL